MKATGDFSTKVAGDVFHLNDVEPFPASMKPGFFQRGDMLVSLRNSSVVLVFELSTMKIKFITIGQFVRQHDPDFVDGNTISVLDNNSVVDGSDLKIEGVHGQSRIKTMTAPSFEPQTYYEASDFYTPILGRHQWLSNGNLLITDSWHGRVFELDPQKTIVWEFMNMASNYETSAIQEAQRIPTALSDTVLKRAAQCPH
jgi:hypothetical protein